MTSKLHREGSGHRLIRIGLFSIAGAVMCALVFFTVVKWNLPPTDGAYRTPLLTAIADPIAIGVIVVSASISALFITPIAFFLLRHKLLLPCAALCFLVVSLEIMIVTPLLGVMGWLGSYPALLAALVFCKFSKHRIFSDQGESA